MLLPYYAAYGLVFFQITQPDHVCLKHALLVRWSLWPLICTKIVIQCRIGPLKKLIQGRLSRGGRGDHGGLRARGCRARAESIGSSNFCNPCPKIVIQCRIGPLCRADGTGGWGVWPQGTEIKPSSLKQFHFCYKPLQILFPYPVSVLNTSATLWNLRKEVAKAQKASFLSHIFKKMHEILVRQLFTFKS